LLLKLNFRINKGGFGMKIGSLQTTDMGAVYRYCRYGQLQELISRTTDYKIMSFLRLIGELRIGIGRFPNHEVCCGINIDKVPDSWLILFLLLRKKDAYAREVWHFTLSITEKAIDLNRLPNTFNKHQLSEFIRSEIIGQWDKKISFLKRKIRELEEIKVALSVDIIGGIAKDINRQSLQAGAYGGGG
jgi:hypothetical protein